jgi:hypothetical protein
MDLSYFFRLRAAMRSLLREGQYSRFARILTFAKFARSPWFGSWRANQGEQIIKYLAAAG